jgi:MFS family permease
LNSPSTPNPKPFILLLSATGISLVGNIFANIAIPWLVLQTTGSAVQTGITGFFTILPIVIAGLLGGTLIDRLGYKRTSVLADVFSGVTVLLIPLLYQTVGLPFWPLMILVFFGSLFDSPGSTARDAMLPELAHQAGISIERATSMAHVVERGSRLVGAPLAGLLISLVGTVNVLWVDAVSFFVCAILVGFFIKPVLPEGQASQKGNYWDELKAGWKFMAGDQLLLAIVIIIMLTNLLDAAFSGVVQPVYIKQVFGSAVNLGLVIAASGGGAVVGGLLFAWIGKRFSRYYVFVFAFILTSARFLVYYFQPSIEILVLGVFICSLGAGPLNPILGAVQFERIPADMRGRVFGAITAGAWIAMPFGMLVGGYLTEALGVFPMLLGLGVLYFSTTVGMFFIPAMKSLERNTLG